MPTNRLEAFSDGVLAVIITIMVLELKPPPGDSFAALGSVGSGLLTYVLSFVYIGIYWNNHHHFFQLVQRIDGRVLWANLHLLFWLSLVPFTTAWTDRSDFARAPVACYGIDLLMCALAWVVMQRMCYRSEGESSHLRRAVGRGLKEKLSPVLYVVGILGAWWQPAFSMAMFAVVALLWVVPDRRMERYISESRPAA
ncbi:MAG TPA: TMEM175 family protein [Segeticoccus sp.]|uniref:TMEM175 family protein n=1 Tax=Segeticoccus sp. TaxID=2706531 RepID=UPI002D7FCE9C|nr:TMEM175 family protein [Segeticoccus sp.]HET8602125.1 TMEM175 family protein [Segeticoccus sp.]